MKELEEPLNQDQFNQVLKAQIIKNASMDPKFAGIQIKQNGYPNYFTELKKLEDSGLECKNPDTEYQNPQLESALDNMFENNYNKGFTIKEIQI